MSRSITRRLMLATLVLSTLLLAPVLTPTAQAGDMPAAPKLVAAKFHADWCGSCKKMGPVFEDLRNKFDGQPILFVTYDRTNQTSRNQSELLASALGQRKAYADNTGTGFILLMNPSSGEIVGKLSSTQNIKEMGAAIKSLIDG